MEEKIADAEFIEMGPTQSPTPGSVAPAVVVEETVDFFTALKEVVKGKKMTKVEWKDREYYGFFKDTLLKLHKPDGKMYDWILNDGDVGGEDWIIL
jgi:hypothetical protein